MLREPVDNLFDYWNNFLTEHDHEIFIGSSNDLDRAFITFLLGFSSLIYRILSQYSSSGFAEPFSASHDRRI